MLLCLRNRSEYSYVWHWDTLLQVAAEKMHKESKYVLFLDDDVRLHPGSIGALTVEMEKNPEVFIALLCFLSLYVWVSHISSFSFSNLFRVSVHPCFKLCRFLYLFSFVVMMQIFIQTGYPLDLPSGSLGSYCIYEYHMVWNISSLPKKTLFFACKMWFSFGLVTWKCYTWHGVYLLSSSCIPF